MAPDGSDVRLVAPDVTPTEHPAVWSPDGKYLTFISEEKIQSKTGTRYGDVAYVAGWDGAGLTRLAEVYRTPVWSLDGTSLVYLSGIDEDPKLWEIGVDGTGLRAIAPGAVVPSEWSPDGTELRGMEQGILSVFNVDESHVRVFVNRRIIDGWQPQGHYASWSPDGSRVAVLASFRKSTTELGSKEEAPGTEIWMPGLSSPCGRTARTSASC